MSMDRDMSQALLEQVNQALNEGTPLRIQGSNSKAMLGNPVAGEVLDTRNHRGIVSYDPTELVLTARAGTPCARSRPPCTRPARCCPANHPTWAPRPPWAAWSRPGCLARDGRGPGRCATLYWVHG